MMRATLLTPRGTFQKRSSFVAGIGAVAAAAFLYVHFTPAPAGANPPSTQVEVSRLAAVSISNSPIARNAGVSQSKTATPLVSKADRLAMILNVTLLDQGRKRLVEASDYTCTFFKQERLGSEMSEGQSIELKMRQKPSSIYMRWLSGDKGRELLYVDGQHDNKIIVHPGGWKARLVPALKLDPEGSLAMSESRHPVTMVGMLKLAEEIINRRKFELDHAHPVRCELSENAMANDRACWLFVSTYLDHKVSGDYRKSVQFVDKELLLPVCVKNYGWPAADQKFADDSSLDDATIVEHYAYTEIQFNQQLANEDFDRGNAAYKFRR